MQEHRFRIGDVFDADDEVSVYLMNLAMGFNDIVFAEVKGSEATEEWEQLYWARLYTAHFYEAMDYVERRSTLHLVRSFIDGLPDQTRAHYESALDRYGKLASRLKKIRHRAVFHYEQREAAKHVRAAIAKNADSTGLIRSGPKGNMFGARHVFADTILSSLVVQAAGGTREDVGHLVDELQGAVKEFTRFVNGALDHWLVEHHEAVATKNIA